MVKSTSWNCLGICPVRSRNGALGHGLAQFDPPRHFHEHLPEYFDEEFHVFSIDWSEDNIDFILDDEVFFNINPNMMNGQPARSTTRSSLS